MIRVDRPVIVEGKYDKIALSNIIDGVIITTEGFGIFKDKEKRDFICRIAAEKGIIVITDSDFAGAVIRSHLKSICPDGEIINVYIPQLKGKEKRKQKASAEGFLGVEGMRPEIIEAALVKSGIGVTKPSSTNKKVTKTDLFKVGLSGSSGSREARRKFSVFIDIPTSLSSNAFLDAINTLFTYNEFLKAVELWQHETVKN